MASTSGGCRRGRVAGRGKAGTAGAGSFFRWNTCTQIYILMHTLKKQLSILRSGTLPVFLQSAPPCPVPFHGSPSSFLIRGNHHSEIYIHHFLVFLSTYPYIAGLFSLILVFNGIMWHSVFWDKFFSPNSIFEIHAC